MNLFEALKQANKILEDNKIKFTNEELRLLLAHCLNKDKSYIFLNSQIELTPAQQKQFFSFIEKRTSDYPTPYILGEVGFYKYLFKVNDKVLIPRPETEQVVELAVNELQYKTLTKVIDFGSGSGCIGLSIAKENKNVRVLLVEKCREALKLSQENAKELDVENQSEFLNIAVESSLEKATEVGFKNADLVVSNPPYIANNSIEVENSVYKYEPHLALFGGELGWELYKGWGDVALQLLKPGGKFICEIGYDQKEILEKVFAKNPLWVDIRFLKDLNQRDRILIVKKGSK